MPSGLRRPYNPRKEIRLLVVALIVGICSVCVSKESVGQHSKSASLPNSIFTVSGTVRQSESDQLILSEEPKRTTAFEEMGKDRDSFFDEKNLDHHHQTVEQRYSITPATKLENIVDLSDIAPGDKVEVQYENQKGQKVATVITKQGS